jgi:hypothetical protein
MFKLFPVDLVRVLRIIRIFYSMWKGFLKLFKPNAHLFKPQTNGLFKFVAYNKFSNAKTASPLCLF